MKKRTTQVNISSAGGTASQGSKTYKVTLPNSWMTAMGIDEDCRYLEISFDGKQIILSRYIKGKEFVTQKLEQRHDVRLLKFYDNNTLCTNIYADFTDKALWKTINNANAELHRNSRYTATSVGILRRKRPRYYH
ncbi:MAG: hypothetical protein FWE83_09545 [Oscillospiraceae bacterium]|nr:hypothetical protein [Oscillospiraceae bacterium]